MSDINTRQLIDVAAGRRPADLLLKNAHIVQIASHELLEGDLAISQGRIVGIGSYEAVQTIDLKGLFLCPGLIDAHLHIESSLLWVPEFSQVVVAHGTTTVIADPHEFANVLGIAGIELVLQASESAPIDILVMLSSCVPASPLESAGATLTADDLRPLLNHPRVLGLAEIMNYPGIINAQDDVLAKIHAAAGKIIDGHAPGLSGMRLNAYAASGIMSDHECITADEAADKLRAGLFIMIREGSQTRNLKALLPLVTPANADRFMFCTDDKDVRDLLDEGQIDYMLRTAVAHGLDPLLAIRLATLSPANYFGLRQKGAILPGRDADLVAFKDLRDFRAAHVFRKGQLIAQDGRCIAQPPAAPAPHAACDTIHIHNVSPDDFRIPCPPQRDAENPPRIHVIHVLENRIDTQRTIQRAAVRDHQLVADPARDLAKIIVIERHAASGRIGRGFVTGFGLKSGAIASTVAHDAHNLIVVGTNDIDMLAAVAAVVKSRGGLAVTNDGATLAVVPLPIAGLVSDQPAALLAEKLRDLCAAARALGCPLQQPFMALSFLSLSVIGRLKLTDRGLIDVEQFRPIPLIAPDE